jgi:hypothetical protein
MCRRIQCETCHKPGYAGCGRHVEQVLGSVAEAERCQCHKGIAARIAPTPSGAEAGESWPLASGA